VRQGVNIKIDKKKYFLPFSLTAFVILLDQLTKAYIVANWPRVGTLISDVFNNEFLLITHVRNPAIAFSIGHNLPDQFRFPLFVIIPVIMLVLLFVYYFKIEDFSKLQRWAVAGIIGGGVGNIIDRIFRPDGVVDFISVKFYGLFGMERWPTFNIADSSVVVCCFIMLFTLLKPQKKAVNE